LVDDGRSREHEVDRSRLFSAERTDDAGQRRDDAADQRDDAGTQRDEVAEQRDDAGHERDRDAGRRDDLAHQRDRAAADRDEVAGRRDESAGERDRAADRRDDAAELRDQAAERSEALLSAAEPRVVASVLARRDAASDRRWSSDDRQAGAVERTHAEHDREIALVDRRAGAGERTQAGDDRDGALVDRRDGAGQRTEAEHDRDGALVDRDASAREREDSYLDGLTGVYLRAAGLIELGREIARTRRADLPLTLGFVDVDGLKATNDTRGHAAGDRMLIEVANAFRARMRSHDLMIRMGGDEFVCAISGLNIADAAHRLTLINAALAEAPEPGSVTVGFAELRPDDSPGSLLARADAALYAERRHRRPSAG
jgi:diguanylate cyclase (GGDEF)-like protein